MSSELIGLTKVEMLDRSCPTCGCRAWDHDGDGPAAQFLRRLAWAGEALGVKLVAHGWFNDGKMQFTSIEVQPADEPFCGACKQHKPCSCDDMEADRTARRSASDGDCPNCSGTGRVAIAEGVERCDLCAGSGVWRPA